MPLDDVMSTDLRPAESAPRFQLPNHAYYEQDWYEREQRLIFARNYNLVGYEVDIPEPGDYLVARAGFEPVLVVRDHDGEIRGYLNMCRHRGITIACENGHTSGNFRCPYHGWEFDLGGALTRVPQQRAQFPDLCVDELGLLPVSIGVWAGMIFVHPDPEAETLEEWLGGYVGPEQAGPYPWDRLEHVARIKVPVACNWKFYIENHIDIYHLWYLHEESLSMYDHHALTCWKEGNHWGCVEPLRPGRDRDDQFSGLLPISGVPDEERGVLRANLIFPNLPFTTSERSVMTYQVVPTGPESCYLDLRVLGEPGSVLADAAPILRVLRDEDGFACEQMQAVVRSSSFAVGPLSIRHELPIHQFHSDVLSFLA
jgi:Rieske 2Fe-2S family protein